MGLLDFLNPLKIITGPLESITKAITDVQLAKARASTDKEKIAADERLRTLEARRDLMIAESGHGVRLNALVRSLFAIVILVYLIKVVIFDLTFGQWTGWATPSLPERFDYIMTVIIGFYFLDSMVARFKK